MKKGVKIRGGDERRRRGRRGEGEEERGRRGGGEGEKGEREEDEVRRMRIRDFTINEFRFV